MDLPSLPDLTHAQALANRALGLREALDEQIAENARQIKDLEDEEQILDLVASLIRQIIDAEVTDGVKAVERLQSEGLREIFYDQELSVRADVEEARGKISVTLLTNQKRKDGSVVEGVSDQSFGGSVLTMQSVLMRITVIYRRKMRPLLLLDETLVAVANRYVDRAARFLSTLCRRLGLDVLLITHDEALVSAAHRAYQVTNHNDRAKFTPISAADSEGMR